VNPSPISNAEQIATGVPNPDAPSMNAPNEKATSSAWIRRSFDTPLTDRLTTSNCPVSTVRLYRKTALRIIHPMGSRPYAAPYAAVAAAVASGMPYTRVETPSAATSPASAALWARHSRSPIATSRSTIGNAAAAVLGHGLPSGS
jgi:hypothetical protein